MEGKDVLGSAQTGTGKTGAFGIPLIANLMENATGSAMILMPTRELATQVFRALNSFLGSQQKRIGTALLIGGEAMPKQIQQLKSRPRLIVGTPGRINDHLGRGMLKLMDTKFLVLDEMDRMLDIGFAPQIEKIIGLMPKDRQTLMFSATMPKNILSASHKYLTNPVRISVGSESKPADNLEQQVMYISESDKHNQLTSELGKRDGSVIVFVKTKRGAEKMAKKLKLESHSADAIHGDLRHGKRERIINEFRNRKYRIMVATDVAARGLDIDHVKHVINYDLPQCPEDFLHRIGRTARAGASGSTVCFVTPQDQRKWRAINGVLNPTAVTTQRDKMHSAQPKKSKAPLWQKKKTFKPKHVAR